MSATPLKFGDEREKSSHFLGHACGVVLCTSQTKKGLRAGLKYNLAKQSSNLTEMSGIAESSLPRQSGGVGCCITGVLTKLSQ